MPDYVFYRTFDVGNRIISDKMDDKVVGLAVTFLFNRKKGERIGNVPKLDADKKEELLEFKTAKTDENPIDLVERGREDIKGSLVGKISLSNAKPVCGAALVSNNVVQPVVDRDLL
ncbi:uncharacterized protein LOC131333353 [Rhododendron vialii]|uniref:uncharacterized protein LOC131333353 n=1 Tax=Rhododendron vialii TaxID=182163 RepID=UPI00265E9BA7|nr:uncharacterized protein LOC131333353 [Rhododendron vialii]